VNRRKEGEPPLRYDLELIAELSEEVGLGSVTRAPGEATIELQEGVALLFRNLDEEDDCVMGFVGTSWHTHGGLMCSDRHGSYVELGYLDIVAGLANGTVLICELWARSKLSDRWLVHKDYVDEFKYLQPGEEVRIRMAPSTKSSGPSS